MGVFSEALMEILVEFPAGIVLKVHSGILREVASEIIAGRIFFRNSVLKYSRSFNENFSKEL